MVYLLAWISAMEDVLPKSTKAHLQLPVREYFLSVVLPEDLWHVLLHLDCSLFVLTNVKSVL
uniref:SYMRK n=1 Tax=Arundo donax TaxID=35708 RepID=A0A0A9G775_ARUDO